MNENEIGKIIIDTAIEIHQNLGPGLFENVYEVILASELREKGLKVETQVNYPVQYKNNIFPAAFRADMVVENKVIIELKSVEKASKEHKKQVLTYLKLSGLKLGYLLNFGAALMKDGISRIINGQIDS
jgi:GxxExxY protein